VIRISMTNEQQHKVWNQIRPLALLAAASMTMALAPAAAARDVAPELSSRAWVESDNEVASVSVNGKDIITFRSRAGSGEAAAEADDLAAELSDLVTDRNFDPSLLLPGKEGEKSAVRLGASTACTFTPLSGKNKADSYETSLKVVNGLRVALGEAPLPNNLPNVGDRCALASANGAFSGKASWYGPHFHGRKCSDGTRFDMEGMTAAHRSLPFGTKLLVMNRSTGASCVVSVNDRGPFIGDRIIDLSKGAARKLNMLGQGVALVDCVIIGQNGSQN
jgi:rare lipoprotein A